MRGHSSGRAETAAKTGMGGGRTRTRTLDPLIKGQQFDRRLPAKTVKISNFLHGSRVLGDGAPEEIRTPDPQIRSLVLYPAELRALTRLARVVLRRAAGL